VTACDAPTLVRLDILSVLMSVVMICCTVQCASTDDNEDDVDDDVEVFNDCDEQVPVVRPIPQSYMIRPPTDSRPFPADTATSRDHPPTSGDGKLEAQHAIFWFGYNTHFEETCPKISSLSLILLTVLMHDFYFIVFIRVFYLFLH